MDDPRSFLFWGKSLSSDWRGMRSVCGGKSGRCFLILQGVDASEEVGTVRFGERLRGRKKLADAQTRFPLAPLRRSSPLGSPKPFAFKSPSPLSLWF